MAKATLIDGRYTARAPEPAGPLETLIARVDSERGHTGTAIAGFDFPIGLPIHYARSIGIDNFFDFLENLGHADWADFYKICRTHAEITPRRPFYPNAPGNTLQVHLLLALEAQELNQLRRTCERAQPDRRAANPLFWTLGANQVGKGAIVGWRDLIVPAYFHDQTSQSHLKLWPFEGTLPTLMQPGTTVIAETYPTQYHSSLFRALPGRKGDQDVRARVGDQLLEWAKKNQVALTPELRYEIQHGFTIGRDDAFDAVIGLFGMIEVALGQRPEGQHPDPSLNAIEGWILGLDTRPAWPEQNEHCAAAFRQ